MDIQKYKFFVRDMSISDDDLTNLISIVINDIAKTTHFFKRLLAFSITRDFTDYNFSLILKLNNRVRTDLDSVTIESMTEDDILNWLKTYDESIIPNVAITTESVGSEINEILLSVNDVLIEDQITSKLKSAFNKFEYLTSNIYRVTDFSFMPRDEEIIQSIATCSVIPDIDNISYDEIAYIENALIEGIKYYTTMSYSSSVDQDTTALLLKKYENEKKSLMSTTTFYDTKQFKKAWL